MVTHGQTVTLLREQRDRFGDVTLVPDGTVANVAVAPRSRWDEDNNRRVLVTAGLTAYAPPGTVIEPTHRVRLEDGTVWLVTGEPASWKSPFTGWSPGVQVELERVTG